MSTPVVADEVRPFPVLSIRDQVTKRLETLDANAVVIAVEHDDTSSRLSVMVRTADGWSFAGWLEHLSARPIRDVGVGFELRKEFR